VSGNGLQDPRVVGDPELVGHREQDRVGGLDGRVGRERLGDAVRLVRATFAPSIAARNTSVFCRAASATLSPSAGR